MKRKDFFKAIGIMAITPAIIPSLLGKEPIHPPVTELSNPKGLAIDLTALKSIPNSHSPEEIIRLWRQTGNIIYKGKGEPVIVPINKNQEDGYNEKLRLMAEGIELNKKYGL
jgi:hypothetical protein